jgi:hypothetical protein
VADRRPLICRELQICSHKTASVYLMWFIQAMSRAEVDGSERLFITPRD